MTNNTINGSARGALVNGGSGAWTITGNTVGGAEQGAGPSGGFEFFGLVAEGSLSVTGNTLNHVGGVAVSFMDSKAAATVTGNTMSNSWGDQGGQLLSTQGMGLVVVDSSALTIDGNTIQNNSYAGVLIDLAWWDTDQDGAAAIIVRNNTVDGHDSRRNLKRQFIPQDASITLENNDIPPLGPPRPGDQPAPPVTVARGAPPAPPRCGDGVVDVGESCDYIHPDAPFACKEDCSLSHGVRHLTAYNRGICAVIYDGTIRCKGIPTSQFGSEWLGNANRNEFTQIPNSSEFEQVALGSRHGCGLKRNGRVWCWGDNTQGQAPGPDPSAQVVFQGIDGDQAYAANPFVSVHAANTHSCARQEQGQVWCWGTSSDGALGLGNSGVDSSASPEKLERSDNNLELITQDFWTGPHNSCAMVNDQYYCWGVSGRLGSQTNGTRTEFDPTQPVRDQNNQNSPLQAGGQLTISAYHVCATDAQNQAYCWGNGGQNRLGIEAGGNAYFGARPVSGLNNRLNKIFSTPYISDNYGAITCGLTESSELWCWGYNRFGLLGQSARYATANKLSIPKLGRIRHMAMSKTKACAIHLDDSIVCWGSDRYLDTEGSSHQPLRAVEMSAPLEDDPPTFLNVHLGDGFGLATANADNNKESAYMWGYQADDNNHWPRVTAVDTDNYLPLTADRWAVSRRAVCYRSGTQLGCKGLLGGSRGSWANDEKQWENIPNNAELACGTQHCCYWVPNANNATCWGNSEQGQAGSLAGTYNEPTVIEVGQPINDLALGDESTCAQIASGVVCWGANTVGQFGGNDTFDNGVLPVMGTNIRTLSPLGAGPKHYCATDSESPGVFCWGLFDADDNAWNINGGGMLSRSPTLVTNTNALDYRRIDHVATDQATACFVHSDTNIACFGGNQYGVHDPSQQSTGWQDVDTTHTGLRSTVDKISMHSGTACLVMNGEVHCWGNSNNFRTATSNPVEYFQDQPD